MPGKILFFEDEINQMGGTFCTALLCAGCLKEIPPEWKESLTLEKETPPKESPTLGIEVLADKFNESMNSKGIYLVGKSLGKKKKKIKEIGDGSEYSLIFIDRNLANYRDIMERKGVINEYGDEKLKEEFFAFFNGFIGDYIYFRLVQNGVPEEKIYFLTANANDDFKIAPFIKISKERVIVKVGKAKSGGSVFRMEDEPDDERQEKTQLEEVLEDRGKDSITRNKYHDIFNSEKVYTLLKNTDNLLGKFLSLLTKMRLNNKIDNPEAAGTTLRLIIEEVVHAIKPHNALKTVRKILNHVEYNKNLRLPDDVFKKIEQDYKTEINKNSLWKEYLDYLNEFRVWNEDKKAMFRTFSTHFFLTYFNLAFSAENHENQTVPKYIWSFIDNIYTTVSECSMHGRGDDTRKLSTEGWYALFNGMCQILTWYDGYKKHQDEIKDDDPEKANENVKKRYQAKIKSLSTSYGFLDFKGEDLYFNKPSFENLQIGDLLEFEIGKNYKGRSACNIRRVPKDSD